MKRAAYFFAAMLGLTTPSDGIEGDGGSNAQSSEVQAVVSFFGPTDFTTRDWPADLETEVIVPFLGGSFVDKPDIYRCASPINFRHERCCAAHVFSRYRGCARSD